MIKKKIRVNINISFCSIKISVLPYSTFTGSGNTYVQKIQMYLEGKYI